MKTTFITNLNLHLLSYPVGDSMNKNKPLVLEMIKTFMEIEEFKDKTVNLLCMGSSGAIIATIFSMTIPNKNRILHVKKQGEKAHDDGNYYHIKDEDTINVIVDDFICSGNTLNLIYDKVERYERKVDCVCVSGTSYHDMLVFKPRYFITQIEQIKEPKPQKDLVESN